MFFPAAVKGNQSRSDFDVGEGGGNNGPLAGAGGTMVRLGRIWNMASLLGGMGK